ncbi:hypothetical protein [Pseudomonas sp. CAM1A]|uniref:hypothetical protein n=1 Tax=Pseudomonas sp. CAM1A TaxID=3231717 RepID=UPI0039C75C4F
MSNEQRALTPFETSVCAALQVVGVTIASLAPERRADMEEVVTKLIKALPADQSIYGGRSEHHIALESLIAGIFPERNK